MISFCDLPLSNAKEHIDKYGGYAIGFTKEWGIKNQLNPVLYLEPNSILAKKLNKFAKTIVHKDNESKIDVLLNTPKNERKTSSQYLEAVGFFEIMDSAFTILGSMKNASGELIRNGNIVASDYKFYDEREWRYIPEIEKCPYMSGSTYKDYRRINPIKPLLKEFALKFRVEDIKYIIIENYKELPELLEILKNSTEIGATYSEREILLTKTLTVEQVFEDS